MNINSEVRIKSEPMVVEHEMSNSKSSREKGKKKRKQKHRFSLNGHKCGYCPLIFNSACEKQRHEAIHTRPYHCGKCSRGFATQSNLNTHTQRVHDKEVVQIKFKSFRTPGSLPRKPNITPSRGCPVCEQVIFGGIKDIEQHCKTHHPDFKYFKCHNCPFKTADSSSLHSHKKVHSNSHPNKCQHCAASFKQLSGLNRHLRAVHDDIPIVAKKSYSSSNVLRMELCSVCGVPIFGKTRMLAHFKLHHPEVKPFKCEKCPFRAASRTAFSVHRTLHKSQLQGSDVHKCPICAAIFKTIFSVNLHIKALHPDSEFLNRETQKPKRVRVVLKKSKSGEYKCQYCGKELNYPSELKVHEARHTLPFPCHICERRFSNKRVLKHHLKSRHRAQPLNTGRLTSNLRITPMEKCPACTDLLRGKTRLGLHLKLYHPGFKAYKCKECPYETSRRATLAQHSRLHYAGDFFKCPFCTASFTRDVSRIDHVEKVHQTTWNDGLVQKIETEVQLQPRQASIHPAGYYNPKEENFEFQVNSTNERCPICTETFLNKNQLNKHLASAHPGVKPYHCSHCPYNCTSSYLLEKHEKLHTEANPFICDHCTASFTSRYSRTIHMNSVHSDIKVEVSEPMANEQFIGSQVQTIVIKEEVEEYDDLFGMLSLRQVRILLTPIIVIDSPNPNTVEVDETSPYVKNLSSNSRRQNSNSKFEIQNLNSKSQTNSYNANFDVKNLNHKSFLKCEKCGETFKFTIALNLHMKKFHMELMEEKQEEDNNHFELVEIKSEPLSPFLEQHEPSQVEESDLERPYKCPNCSYSTFEKSNFRRHGKLANCLGQVYEDESDIIDQDTPIPTARKTRGSLRKASPYEFPKVPPKRPRPIILFVCTICKHQFSLKEELERHVASKCELKSKELDTHKTKIVKPEKGVQKEISKMNNVPTLPRPICPLCNETFAVNTDFKTHLLENHGAKA